MGIWKRELVGVAFAVLVGVSMVGCADGGSSSDGGAGSGNRDLSMSTRDDDMTTGGDDMTTGADLAAQSGCTKIATWPGLQQQAFYDSVAPASTIAQSTDKLTAPLRVLTIFDYHSMGETYPKAINYSSADTVQSCEVCTTLDEGCNADGLGCTASYFAQAGSITVSKSSTDENMGHFTATAKNVMLVEWDFTNDVAVAGGKCFEIASISYDVGWVPPVDDDGGAPVDGGTDDMSAGTTSSLLFQGDFVTNNTTVLGRVTLPGGTPAALGLGGEVKAFDATVDGKKIAVALDANTTGRYDLYVANADGTGVKALDALSVNGTNKGAITEIQFSPDGTLIAYRADLDGTGLRDIYVIPTAGGVGVTRKKLSPDRGVAASTLLQPSKFAWSRDSKYVAISGDYNTDHVVQLFLVDATAATSTPVIAVTAAQVGTPGTADIGVTGQVLWTPAGKVILKSKFATDAGFVLRTFNPTGVGSLALLPNGPVLPAQPATFSLSPDGTKIAFGADSVAALNAYELYVMPSDGSAAAMRVTSGTTSAVPPDGGTAVVSQGVSFTIAPSWSPDGTKIAYVADALLDGKNDAFVVSASGVGGEKRVLTVGGVATDAARDVNVPIVWSPDSTQLALIGDQPADDVFVLLRLPNVTTADQTPIIVQGVPLNGDITDVRWTP